MRGGSAVVVGDGLLPGVPFRSSRGSKAWIDWGVDMRDSVEGLVQRARRRSVML